MASTKEGGEHIGGLNALEDSPWSINYSLKGSANKYWLFLYARDITELERLYQNKMETLQTVMSSNCPRLMLHKNLYMYTNFLQKHNIPFDTVCQKETQMA
uniref:Uncharacterized protein n=1 Tax=Panagrolaimus superbus TaxID=310955 RepID=A0A914Y4D1_9BILA